MTVTVGSGEMVSVEGRLLPRRTVMRSLFLANMGTCFGVFFFSLVSGNIFNRFIEHAGFKELIPVFIAVTGLSAIFQVAGSWILQKTGRRRTFFFLFTIPLRMMWVLVVFLPDLFPGKENEGRLLVALLAVSFIYWVGNRLASNAWTSWIRDLVPERTRGRFFGFRMGLVMLVGACAGLLWGYLLERLGLDSFAFKVIFVAGMMMGVLDIVVYFFVHHPQMRIKPRQAATFGGMFRAAMHRSFRRFVYVHAIWVITSTMVGISMYFLMRDIGMEIYAMQSASFLGTLVWLSFSALWGLFIDRFGTKPAFIAALMVHSVSPIFYALAPDQGMVFVFLGIAFGSIGASGVSLASNNLIYDLSQSEDQAMSFAASQMVVGLVGAGASLLTGQVLYPLFKAHTPSWADPGTFYLMAVFSMAILLRWVVVTLAMMLPEKEEGPRAWVVVRLFYTTNPIRAAYSLGRFLRAKSSDVFSDGSYGREHPSARWDPD